MKDVYSRANVLWYIDREIPSQLKVSGDGLE